ncbi:DUF998 domain-containing protein [Micromonospora sp. NBC_01796]|uniref:DUF998 domain-containing protein n=1 Tax=Micromonospora sp. NBC_01796 TaxID=2975987 RepID=UPI002DDA0294|nr:DUF998 domain-containing protein [Micromonospora sp. NBC_01796]WSA86161.1 DUF998 domain-containing protein [Micromonospora sp. NBC_01796]
MRPVPWWALLSAIGAPFFLIGGWTAGAARQPDHYDPVFDTISVLAGPGATDPWIMQLGLAAAGACYLVTAIGLVLAGVLGRALLALGGIATGLVALFPQPENGGSDEHAFVAGTAFVALALWPLASTVALRDRFWPTWADPTAPRPWAVRRPAAIIASLVPIGLCAWFGVEMFSRGPWIGLTERFAAGAESIWPMVVAISARLAPSALPAAGTDSATEPSPVE